MMTGMAVSPANRNLLALYSVSAAGESSGNAAEFVEHYRQPQVSRRGELKNLVFIYVESLEGTYLDPTVFPGLTPNLGALLTESWHFTDIGQAEGTGWTIAGMVASQCGTPPFLPAADEEISLESASYLPGATCMGDIMKDAGYYLEYLGGASLEFAEKGNFLKTHGFAAVKGKEELLPDIDDPDYFSDWGLYDDSLFQIARQRFETLSQSSSPFGLFMLTLDTHHNGYVSEYCEGIRYGDGENSILNTVHCTDRLLAGFIEALRRSPGARQTVIVVASDHLAMRNSAWEELTQQQRRNLFLIIEPTDKKQGRVDRPGTTLDVGPTVLSQLGLELAGLGFGRNLYSGEQTLRESVEELDKFLVRQKPYITALWR
jgi:phosphoglycerol transferase